MKGKYGIAVFVTVFAGAFFTGCATSPAPVPDSAPAAYTTPQSPPPAAPRVKPAPHPQPRPSRAPEQNHTTPYNSVPRTLARTEHQVATSLKAKSQELEKAWDAYRHFEYELAFEYAQQAVTDSAALPKQKAEAAILAGASVYLLGRSAEVQDWFTRAVQLDPATRPNPAYFPGAVRRLYELARKNLEKDGTVGPFQAYSLSGENP